METQVKPQWAKKAQAAIYSGLSVRLLDDLISRNIVRSSLVRQPGCKRGARLINLASLDDYIESGIGQKTDLEMNQNRGGAA